MRFLYIASSPDKHDLVLDREITELQRSVIGSSVTPVEFVFLPDTRIEDVAHEICKLKPDILHLAAHGDNEGLALRAADDEPRSISAEMLKAFLPIRQKPKIIYLNACNSHQIAKKLTDSVDVAIGSTAPISNRAARAAAVHFYRGLASGCSVTEAFETSKKVMECLESNVASLRLFARSHANPSTLVLNPIPLLVASFDGREVRRLNGKYSIRLGVVGCPTSTVQIVFFTDDELFIDNKKKSLEQQLCSVVRSRPVRGAIWTDKRSTWVVPGDSRIFAVGITSDQRTFSIASTICDAINEWCNMDSNFTRKKVVAALSNLSKEDGSNLKSRFSQRNGTSKGPGPKR